VAIGAGIGTAGNGHLPVAHGLGERTGAEIRVAVVGGADHVHAQLQRFRYVPPKALRAVQGDLFSAGPKDWGLPR